MKSKHVTFEIAKGLKTAGFKEPCSAYFSPKGEFHLSGVTNNGSFYPLFVTQKDIYETDFLAPTFTQAIEWFQKQYNHIKEKYASVGYTDEESLEWLNKMAIQS
jgi:hypothetical protein